jgi:hypothetical protein
VKAITLTQPWATLVAIGAKRIETRSWGTNYRGPLAIHAAKGYPLDARQFTLTWGHLLNRHGYRVTRRGFDADDDLPRGAVVATCCVADCVRIDPADPAPALAWFERHAAEQDREFGDYTLGRYMWLLADVVALPKPFTVRGALGLWDWDMPLGVQL